MGIPFWRDVSLVLLALEAFVLALIPLAIAYGINRGLWKLRPAVRPAFCQVRARAEQVQQATGRASEGILLPIITVHALAARVVRTLSAMAGIPRGGIRR